MRTDNIQKLEWHAGLDPRVETEGLKGTFAGMLRPFEGLKPQVLVEVKELAERLFKDDLDAASRLRAVAALLELTALARGWGLDPDSMLARNHLLRPSDAKVLLAWTRELEEIGKRLCEGG